MKEKKTTLSGNLMLVNGGDCIRALFVMNAPIIGLYSSGKKSCKMTLLCWKFASES